jgi:hypothetical protein
MSVYGVNTSTGVARGGQIEFTGWSPTLSIGDANAGSASGAVQFNGQTQHDYRLSYILLRRSNRALKELLSNLIGAESASINQVVNVRVQATNAVAGGLVPIENETIIYRDTTDDDIDMLVNLVIRTCKPSSYPPDLSGNGGGGKLRYQGIS